MEGGRSLAEGDEEDFGEEELVDFGDMVGRKADFFLQRLVGGGQLLAFRGGALTSPKQLSRREGEDDVLGLTLARMGFHSMAMIHSHR